MCTKICKGPCGLELPATTEYFQIKYSDNRKYWHLNGECKSCRNIKEKEYRKTYNKDAQSKSKKKYLDKITEELNDFYVGRIITRYSKLDRNCLSKELIELKRQQLLLHRTLKNISNGKTNDE